MVGKKYEEIFDLVYKSFHENLKVQTIAKMLTTLKIFIEVYD